MTFARRYVGASPITSTTRAINSAGECFLHMEEVRGSNPLLPTKNQAKAILPLLGFFVVKFIFIFFYFTLVNLLRMI